MVSISFAKALGKAAMAMTSLQSKIAKKADDKTETSSSVASDILPDIEIPVGGPLVTRPNPIPLEIIKDDSADESLLDNIALPAIGKENTPLDAAPEPNVEMVSDLNEIRARKKGGQSQKPEIKEKMEAPAKKPGIPEKLAVVEAKAEIVDHKSVIPESKPLPVDKKVDPHTDQSDVKSIKTESQGKKAESVAVAGPDKKPSENTGGKNLFDNLFNKAEEKEVTPLDRLIAALPEITIEEVLSESAELNSLIVDWNDNHLKQTG